MPSNVKHKFASAKADDPDMDLIRPSNWNEEHLGAVEVIDRDLATVDVANTVTETVLYSQSIPAGQLGADGGIRLTLSGDMLANVAGTVTLRVKLGATIVLATPSTDFADSPARRNWQMVVEFMNSAVNAQKWTAFMHVMNATSDNFPLGLADIRTGVGLGTSSEDTNSALTLQVTAQWSVANASLSFRKEMAILEEIPKA